MPLIEKCLSFDFSAAQSSERLDKNQQGISLPRGMCLCDFLVTEVDRHLLLEIKDPCGTPTQHRDQFADYINNELLDVRLPEKCRDSYLFLHLMNKDDREIVFVAFLGISCFGAQQPEYIVALGDRLRKNAYSAGGHGKWSRNFVKVILVTDANWSEVFRNYPLVRLNPCP